MKTFKQISLCNTSESLVSLERENSLKFLFAVNSTVEPSRSATFSPKGKKPAFYYNIQTYNHFAAYNGTSGESNGTFGESNETSGESNGTSGESNGTSGESNGTFGESNGTSGESNGTSG